MAEPSRLQVVIALGTTQTLAWASSYYLPAILARPIARDLAVSETIVFAAFSAALLLTAALGQRWDGRSTGAEAVMCWFSRTSSSPSGWRCSA